MSRLLRTVMSLLLLALGSGEAGAQTVQVGNLEVHVTYNGLPPSTTGASCDFNHTLVGFGFLGNLCDSRTTPNIPVGHYTLQLGYAFGGVTIVPSQAVDIVAGETAVYTFDVSGAVGIVSGRVQLNGQAPPSGWGVCGSTDGQACAGFGSGGSGDFALLLPAGAGAGFVWGDGCQCIRKGDFNFSVTAGAATDIAVVNIVPGGDLRVRLQYAGAPPSSTNAACNFNLNLIGYGFLGNLCDETTARDIRPGQYGLQLGYAFGGPLLDPVPITINSGQLTDYVWDVSSLVGFVTGRATVNHDVPPAGFGVCGSTNGQACGSGADGTFRLLLPVGRGSGFVWGNGCQCNRLASFSFDVQAGQTTDVGTQDVELGALKVGVIYRGAPPSASGAACSFNLTLNGYGFLGNLCDSMTTTGIPAGQYTAQLGYAFGGALMAAVPVTITGGATASQTFDVSSLVGIVTGHATINGAEPGSGFGVCGSTNGQACQGFATGNGTFNLLLPIGPGTGFVWGNGCQCIRLASFTFSVEAGTTVNIGNPLAPNHPPVADSQSVSTPVGRSLGVTLTAGDPDGDQLTFAIVSMPAHGSLTGMAPSVVYTPAAGYFGADAFQFRATDPSGASATASVGIDVFDRTTPTVTIASPAATIYALGQVVQASFACDDQESGIATCVGTAANGGTVDTSSPGSRMFSVVATDRAGNKETATLGYSVNAAPSARETTVATAEDTAVDITISGTDGDGSALQFTISQAPAHGTLGTIQALTSTTARTTYTPNPDFNGSDVFAFSVGDGLNTSAPALVHVAVAATDDPPVLTIPGSGVDFASSGTVGNWVYNTVASADVNGDGLLDLVATTDGWVSVDVLLGRGDGTFAYPMNNIVGTYPSSVAVADFNADGIPDIATALPYPSAEVGVLLGNGDGTFKTPIRFTAGLYPLFVAAGDLDGDGRPDLITADGNGHNVITNLSRGDGHFGPGLSYFVPSGPHQLSLGDFNHDGRLDVAVATYQENHVAILFGNGDGTLAAPVFIPLTSPSWWVQAADVDGNGTLDLVVLQDQAHKVTVIFGDGRGSFSAGPSFPVNQSAQSLTVADINGDGTLDAIVPTRGGRGADILLGNGDGTFRPGPSIVTGHLGWSAAVGQFDLSGGIDLAMSRTDSSGIDVFLSRPSRLSYVENAAPLMLAPAAVVTDVDSADFEGGTLTVALALNGSDDDRLVIVDEGTAPGQIGVTGGLVTFGGVPMGSFVGGTIGADPLVVTFDAIATPAAAQALTRRLAFVNASNRPSTAPRTIRFAVTDGDGGTSAPADVVVNVQGINDPPVAVASGSPAVAEATGPSGASFTLDGSLSSDPDGDELSFQWVGPFAGTLGGARPTVTLPPPASPATTQTSVVTLRLADGHGGTASTQVSLQVTDTTPPAITGVPEAISITATSADGAPATFVVPTASDLVDGVRAVACDRPSGSVFPLGTTTITCSSSDTRGNSSIATFTVSVLDGIKPTITIQSPIANAHYVYRQQVTTAYACADAESGVATCAGSVRDSEPLDTSIAGPATFVVTATDRAGNAATVSVPYIVDKAMPHVSFTGSGVFTYNGLSHGAVVSVRGVDGEDLGAAQVTYDGSTALPVNAGTYEVHATFAGTDAYETATAIGSISIGQAPLAITANDAAREFGAADPVFSARFDRFRGGDTAAVLWGTLTFSDGANASSAPGNYPLTPAGVSSHNYLITFVPGTLTVRDTTAPVVTVPADLTLEATRSGGAIATFVASASDAVDGATATACTPASGSLFPFGTTGVACSSTDAHGNTGTSHFAVTVRDTTAPAIASVSPSTASLWPPNKAMIADTIAVSAADAGDAAPRCRISGVTSNEPVSATGDWVVTGDLTVSLRADRRGNDTGRVYTITVACTDASGNVAAKTTVVTVPHDQGK